MAPRLDLHMILRDLLGSSNVYFQPPPNLQMTYPCIRYEREQIDIVHADNKPYKHLRRYQVTVIDENPDSTIVQKIAELPTAAYDRFYTADGLNHDVFRIFF